MGKICKLELQNFKSYGGKHVIEPFYRFMAIIGPNGSGKSNLMDAICFVLGLKSRHLRSTQLKDLIFQNMKEKDDKKVYVTLCYELDEENEVEGYGRGDKLTFTRSLSYPNGNSSYALNEKEVTYEFYESILNQIGIMVKVRNFLVFQGDVENVASKKPQELTALFEQISGSAEFKEQYDKLIEEKNQTEENVLYLYQRKKGLMQERKNIKEQKDESEKYMNLCAQKKSIQTELYLWQTYQTQLNIDKNEEASMEIETEMDENKSHLAKLTEEYENKKSAYSSASREFNKNKRHITEQNEKTDRLEPQFLKLKEDLKYCKNRKKKREKELNELLQKRRTRETEKENLENEITELKRKCENLNNDAEEGGLEGEQLKEYYKIKENAKKETSSLREEYKKLKLQVNSDKSHYDSLLQEEKDVADEITSAQEECVKTTKRISELHETVSSTMKKIKIANEDLCKFDIEKAKQEKQHQELQSRFEDINERLRSLRENHYHTRSEQRQISNLEQLKKIFPGVYGRLVDLCKPIQRKYNLAVTMATGKNMNAIVTDTQRTAQECVKYLKDQCLGTFSFIPLDKIRTKPINERLRSLGANVKLAVDVIECHPDIKLAVHYGVSDTIICNNLTSARRLRFEENIRVKVVTLDGMIINKNGSMQGGRTDKQDDRRSGQWDKKEIDTLKDEREKIATELKEYEMMQPYQTIEAMKSRIETMRSTLRYAETDLQTMQNNLAESQNRIGRFEEKRSENNKKMKALQNIIETQNAEADKITNEINSIEDKLLSEFSRSIGVENIRQYEETMVERKKEIQKKQVEMKERIAKLEAQLQHLKSYRYDDAVKDVESSINKLEIKINQIEQSFTDIETQMQSCKDTVIAYTEKQEKLESRMSTIETELKKLLREKKVINKQLQDLSSQLSNVAAKMEHLNDKKYSLLKKALLNEILLPLKGKKKRNTLLLSKDSSLASVDMEDISLTSLRLSSEDDVSDILSYYKESEIDYSTLAGNVSSVEEDEFMRITSDYEKKILSISESLETMQPDLKAGEKYDEIERKIEEEDIKLEEARQLSNQMSQEFEKFQTARYTKFMNAFNVISGCINEIYQRLTRSKKHPLGGTAYLSLENSEEPYLYGVKYNTIPPMKRFRNIEQLSGGEKTVSALALLFAIHRYSPSPFFVLDEIDAALDNVNVNKVSHYIEKYCPFQTIVISLKDTFYGKVNAIIGIAKDVKSQESRIYTLDLTNLNKESKEEEENENEGEIEGNDIVME